MSKATILLVEDNEDNQAIYRTILEHFDYTVLDARNGKRGIEIAQESHPDLILMDISIPVIDGWTAIRTLKQDQATAEIPIVALTAHALQSDRDKAMQLGCDGYLAKPVEPREVIAEVNRILSPAAGPTTAG